MALSPGMLIVAVATFFCLAAFGLMALESMETGARRKGRVENVAGRAKMRSKRAVSALDAAAQRKKQLQETLAELEERQRKQRKRSVTLKAQIQQAGLDITPRTFWLMAVGLGAAAAAITLILGRPPLIAAALGVGCTLGLPRWTLGFLRGRRMKKFTNEFANALDVITRGVKSGLPLGECLKIIAQESPEPIAGEFKLLTEGQSLGVCLDEGLKRMYERMPLQDIAFFSIVLSIQSKTGGNLAEALSNLAAVIRSRKMMREKIAALSSEAKASAFIIGSLPPLVLCIVYVTTPSYAKVMFEEDLGRLLLLGGLTWMGIGIFIMRKMINFKI